MKSLLSAELHYTGLLLLLISSPPPLPFLLSKRGRKSTPDVAWICWNRIYCDYCRTVQLELNKQTLILYRKFLPCPLWLALSTILNTVARKLHSRGQVKKSGTAHPWKLCLTGAYSVFKQVLDCVFRRRKKEGYTVFKFANNHCRNKENNLYLVSLRQELVGLNYAKEDLGYISRQYSFQ